MVSVRLCMSEALRRCDAQVRSSYFPGLSESVLSASRAHHQAIVTLVVFQLVNPFEVACRNEQALDTALIPKFP